MDMIRMREEIARLTRENKYLKRDIRKSGHEIEINSSQIYK